MIFTVVIQSDDGIDQRKLVRAVRNVFENIKGVKSVSMKNTSVDPFEENKVGQRLHGFLDQIQLVLNEAYKEVEK